MGGLTLETRQDFWESNYCQLVYSKHASSPRALKTSPFESIARICLRVLANLSISSWVRVITTVGTVYDNPVNMKQDYFIKTIRLWEGNGCVLSWPISRLKDTKTFPSVVDRSVQRPGNNPRLYHPVSVGSWFYAGNVRWWCTGGKYRSWIRILNQPQPWNTK